nr:translocase of chloroplast 159, chloroplastic-like isoform X1 [Ipomoea trifida]
MRNQVVLLLQKFKRWVLLDVTWMRYIFLKDMLHARASEIKKLAGGGEDDDGNMSRHRTSNSNVENNSSIPDAYTSHNGSASEASISEGESVEEKSNLHEFDYGYISSLTGPDVGNVGYENVQEKQVVVVDSVLSGNAKRLVSDYVQHQIIVDCIVPDTVPDEYKDSVVEEIKVK